MFFSKIIFVEFIFFNFEMVKSLALWFFSLNIFDCYSVSPHSFCFGTVFFHLFFSKIIFVEFNFFNFEMVKSLAL